MSKMDKFFSMMKREGISTTVVQSARYLESNFRLSSAKRRLSKLKGDFPVPVIYNNFKLNYFNDNDHNELLYHSFGEQTLRKERDFLSEYIKGNSIVFDIGANAGFFSLTVSALNSQGGRVYAFEPSLKTWKKLISNIELNNLNNVIPVNSGAGSKQETLTLFYNPEQTGLSSIVNSGDNFISEQIEIVTLDNFCAQNDIVPDFIKIDTEGFEPDVITGAESILRKYRPVVYPELSYLYPESSMRAIDLLKSFGYYPVEKIGDIREVPAGSNFIFLKRD